MSNNDENDNEGMSHFSEELILFPHGAQRACHLSESIILEMLPTGVAL